MSLSDIRKRLAALEQVATITRICLAYPALEGAVFRGFQVAPMFVQEWHDPAENFAVFDPDPKECQRRAHDLANERWLKDPLLTVRLDPITVPETHR